MNKQDQQFQKVKDTKHFTNLIERDELVPDAELERRRWADLLENFSTFIQTIN
jgi:hypothetical protein